MEIYEQNLSSLKDCIDITSYGCLGDIISFTVKKTPEIIECVKKYKSPSTYKYFDSIFLNYSITEKRFFAYLQFSKKQRQNDTDELKLNETHLKNITSDLRLTMAEVDELLTTMNVIH